VLIEFPIFWIVVLNVGGWLVIQLGLAWAFLKLPANWFNTGDVRAWKRGGRFYETVFLIKRWPGLNLIIFAVSSVRPGAANCVTGSPSRALRCSSFGILGGAT